MLKITTQKHKNKTRFVVEGKLAASTINILERCWREADTAQIEIEFTDITFVDEKAKELLRKMISARVQMTAHDIQMKAILENLSKEEKEL